MHGSVIAVQAHRTLEAKRRTDNLRKKQAHGLVRAFGLDPAHTPCVNPEGTHKERRKASHPERRMRREFKVLMSFMTQ